MRNIISTWPNEAQILYKIHMLGYLKRPKNAHHHIGMR